LDPGIAQSAPQANRAGLVEPLVRPPEVETRLELAVQPVVQTRLDSPEEMRFDLLAVTNSKLCASMRKHTTFPPLAQATPRTS